MVKALDLEAPSFAVPMSAATRKGKFFAAEAVTKFRDVFGAAKKSAPPENPADPTP
jgi:hypothetical protein